MNPIQSRYVETCYVCAGSGKEMVFDDKTRKWIKSGEPIFDPIHNNWKYSDIVKCKRCDGIGKVRIVVYNFEGKWLPQTNVFKLTPSELQNYNELQKRYN